MQSRTHTIASVAELELEAKTFIDSLVPSSSATLVTLSGTLGAGKTTFAQLVAKSLGITDTVNSPTFVIQKVYSIPAGKFSRLVHIDAYRLNGAHDLEVLGFDELLAHPETLVLLEWPERVPEIAEKATVRITLDPLASESRQITYA